MIKNSQAHLKEVKETYLKHMAVNFKIGLSTLLVGFKFLIHGIIPALFKKNWVNQLNDINYLDFFIKVND